jgi:hypothetical protein
VEVAQSEHGVPSSSAVWCDELRAAEIPMNTIAASTQARVMIVARLWARTNSRHDHPMSPGRPLCMG